MMIYGEIRLGRSGNWYGLNTTESLSRPRSDVDKDTKGYSIATRPRYSDLYIFKFFELICFLHATLKKVSISEQQSSN